MEQHGGGTARARRHGGPRAENGTRIPGSTTVVTGHGAAAPRWIRQIGDTRMGRLERGAVGGVHAQKLIGSIQKMVARELFSGNGNTLDKQHTTSVDKR